MEYMYGPGVDFFIKEMNVQKLNLFLVKYLKLVLFLKMLLFEMCITSLQMLPEAQIYLMTFIQAVVLFMLIYAVIRKAFAAWYFAIGDLFIETTVFLFLLLGSLNRFNGVTPETVEIHYRQYQLYMIYLILITTAVLLV
jgi:hypothetical protein